MALFYRLKTASDDARAQVDALSKMDAAALDSGPDFRRRLLVLRASLNRSETVPSINPINQFVIRRPLSARHQSTLETLKTTLGRAPLFGGEFDAVGMDTARKMIVALKLDNVEEYDLEKQTEFTLAKTADYSIKEAPPSRNLFLKQGPAAVGFIGQGTAAVPAVIRDGVISYWFGGERKQRDLDDLLPVNLLVGQSFPPMVEFDGGKLQIVAWIREVADTTKSGELSPPGFLLKIFRFGLDELVDGGRAETEVALQRMPPMSRPPVFSHRMTEKGLLAFATDFGKVFGSN